MVQKYTFAFGQAQRGFWGVIAGVVVAAVVVLAAVSVGYIYLKSRQSEKAFEAFVQPLHEACQQESGCLLELPGWSNNVRCLDVLPGAQACSWAPENSIYKGMYYQAKEDEFMAQWSYDVDSLLTVHGGRGMVLDIQKYYDNQRIR